MKNLVSFKTAEIYFRTWALNRQTILVELRRVEIESRRQTMKSNTHSKSGLVSGGLAITGIIAAPFTAGASLALTVAGAAVGVISAVAGSMHGSDESKTSKKQYNISEILKDHEQECKEMKKFIMLLIDDIRTTEAEIRNAHAFKTAKLNVGLYQSESSASRGKEKADKLAEVVRVGVSLEKVVQSTLTMFTERSTKAYETSYRSGLLEKNFSTVLKGTLSELETTILQENIEQMEHDYEVLNDFFIPYHKKLHGYVKS